MIEARRLRSVINTWHAIPPPTHVRREMLARVMELSAAASHASPSVSGVTRRQTPAAGLAATALDEVDVGAEVPTIGAYQAPSGAPSSWVRSRRSNVSESQTKSAVAASKGVSVLRADAVPWRPFAMSSGVLAKVLRRDLQSGSYTALLRMPGGAELPAHRHAGPEEMFVIEGSLRVGETLMHAGDACHADAGSVHPVIRTAGGCLVFLVASSRDQVL